MEFCFFAVGLLQHILPDPQVIVKIAHEEYIFSVIVLYRNNCYKNVDQACWHAV